jgi:hypothetical protein
VDGRKGKVRLGVYLDGKEVSLEKATRRHRDEALRLNVELNGAKELTLEVGLGEEGHVGAVVNWANAVLLK